ncbi:tol-Pal system protein TolA [Procambarus clarkii]|uniref:tol-Pal system protein TolA n=1 Tax=Procambarus clarkii TaxID=6728 RepID=UPI001E672E07|nr:uncharacterized protein LOC123745685 [Procambarus clarkii]
MTLSSTVLTAGLLAVTAVVLLFSNRSLNTTLKQDKERSLVGFKKRDEEILDCKDLLQRENNLRTGYEQKIKKTEEEKVGLTAEVNRKKDEVAKLQKSTAEAEAKKKEVEALTKSKEDFKKQLNETLKRVTDADKVKADLQAKLTEALAKKSQADAAAAAAKDQAAKAKAAKG